MKLYLRTLRGPTVPIELPHEATLQDLNEMVESVEGVPAHFQVLTHQSKALITEPLPCQEGATINLSLSLLGGGKKNMKGRRKHYTTGEEAEAAASKEAREKAWNKKHGGGEESDEEDSDEDEYEEEEEKPKPAKKKNNKKKKPVVLDQYGIPITDSEEETSDEDEDDAAAPIEVINPNRQPQKMKKMGVVSENAEQLSRKDREAIQKQEAERKYQKLHAAGKTEEARADLERLSLIRKQREEAAAKKKALEEAKAAKKAATQGRR